MKIEQAKEFNNHNNNNNNNEFFNRIKTSTIIKIAVITVCPVQRKMLEKKKKT